MEKAKYTLYLNKHPFYLSNYSFLPAFYLKRCFFTGLKFSFFAFIVLICIRQLKYKSVYIIMYE